MVLVNEEILKDLDFQKTSDFKFELTGSNPNYILKISKLLYSNFMSNSIPISYLRLYFEGNGTVNIEKLFVYKFNETKFEKLNNIDTNTISLPISATINNNGFIDVPIGTMDETIELEIIVPATFKRMYVAINGSITGIRKEDLSNYLANNP